MLAGIVIGCGTGLLRDKQTDLIYSEDELKSLLPGQLLAKLQVSNSEQWGNTIQLLAEGPLAGAESVGLVPIGALVNDHLDKFSQSLQIALNDRSLVVGTDLLANRQCSSLLLITAPGAAQRKEIQQLSKHLDLHGTPIAGWLLIDVNKEG